MSQTRVQKVYGEESNLLKTASSGDPIVGSPLGYLARSNVLKRYMIFDRIQPMC
jgi:hypothetical protein